MRYIQVDYSRELGPPIVTLKDARKQNSFHSVPPLPGTNTNLPNGEKSAVPYVEKCPMQIRGAKWHMPTQVRLSHPVAQHTDISKALHWGKLGHLYLLSSYLWLLPADDVMTDTY